MKKFFLRTGKLLIALVIFILLIIAGIFVWLRSEHAENTIITKALPALNEVLEANGIKIEVGSLKGPLPFAAHLKGIKIYDSEGLWLSAETVDFGVIPSKLLSYEFAGSLLVDGTTVYRLPVLPASEAAPDPAEQSEDLYTLLDKTVLNPSLPSVLLDKVAVRNFHAEEKVAGFPFSLDAELKVSLDGAGLAADADLAVLPYGTGAPAENPFEDEDRAVAKLNATIDHAHVLGISHTLNDPKGCLIALGKALGGLPQSEKSSLFFELQGKESINEWHGTFKATLEEPAFLTKKSTVNGAFSLAPLSVTIDTDALPSAVFKSGNLSTKLDFVSGLYPLKPSDENAVSAKASIAVTADGLGWHDGQLEAFVGPALSFSTDAEAVVPMDGDMLGADSPLALKVSQLKLDTSGLSAEGSASLSAKDAFSVKSAVKGSLTSLSVFVPDVEAPLDYSVMAEGSVFDPTVSVLIGSPAITLAHNTADSLKDVSLRLTSSPSADAPAPIVPRPFSSDRSAEVSLKATFRDNPVAADIKAIALASLWNGSGSATAEDQSLEIAAADGSPLDKAARSADQEEAAESKASSKTPGSAIAGLPAAIKALAPKGSAADYGKPFVQLPSFAITGFGARLSGQAALYGPFPAESVPFLQAAVNGSIADGKALSALLGVPLVIGNAAVTVQADCSAGQALNVTADLPDAGLGKSLGVRGTHVVLASDDIWHKPITLKAESEHFEAAGASADGLQLNAELDDIWSAAGLNASVSLKNAVPAAGAFVSGCDLTIKSDSIWDKPIQASLAVDNAGLKGAAEVTRARLEASVDNALGGDPFVSLKIDADNCEAAGRIISPVAADIKGSMSTGFAISAETRGDTEFLFSSNVSIKNDGSGVTAALNGLKVHDKKTALSAGLTGPAHIAAGSGGVSADQLRINFGPSGVIETRGGLTNGRIDCVGSIRNVSLDQIPGADLKGRVDAAFSVKGTALSPEGDLKLTVKRFMVPGTEKPLPLDLYLNAALKPSGKVTMVSVDAGLDENNPFGASPARIKAAIPVDFASLSIPENAPVSADVSYDGKLASLWDLAGLSDRKLTGGLKLSGGVKGTLKSPRIDISADLSGGKYTDLPLGVQVNDINAKVFIADTKAIKLTASCRDNASGTVNVDGSVLLPDFTSQSADLMKDMKLDVKATANDFKPLHRQDAAVSLSADVSVTGTPLDPIAEGTITVNKGNIDVGKLNVASVPTLEIYEEEAAAEAGPPKQGRSMGRLDIAIVIPNQLFIRGPGLITEWKGALNVAGSPALPKVSGEINGVRGSMDFMGKKFLLSKGSVYFDGSYPIVPFIDMALTCTTKSKLDAIIGVSGAPSSLKLELTSKPMLPQDEILARVLFDSSLNDLTPFEKIQLAAAVAQLTGFSKVNVLDSARSALGVDVLRLGSDDDTDSMTVEVGKYVMDNVYMGIEQSVSSNETNAIVEVELTPRISAKAKAGTEDTEVGLEWRYDY